MQSHLLENKKALVVGVANENSIAYGCAKMLKNAGAEIAITYLNDKTKSYVDKAVAPFKPTIYEKCDVTNEDELVNLFDKINSKWHSLDILVHSIAFAPKSDLHGPVINCSKEGFLLAMDISCHSFIKMAKLARPLMNQGGSMFAMSFYGAKKVVQHYNMMGPVKAALEACVRYMAVELGPEKIRVITISPGPVQTRAASGIESFDTLLEEAKERSPLKALADINDVGAMVAYLASDYAKTITGETIYIDAGYNLLG